MGRKQRIDSVGAAVKVAQSAGVELLPPEHNPLPGDAMPFWRAIVCGRARAEWDAAPALLSTAASLAWTQWQIAKLRQEVQDQPVPDARAVQRMSDMQRLEMAYLRTLQQHGRAVVGEARDTAKRRAFTGEIEAAFEGDDAGLLN